MDVLILGWSDIVRRRVLPALASVPGIDRVHIATTGQIEAGTGVNGTVWTGADAVDRALDSVPQALVYVSGVNTDHAPRTWAALTRGHHVIVDKPAFVGREPARQCLELASASGLMLAEATVWSWHAQVQDLLGLIERQGWVPRDVRSTFTIPALPSQNFRTDPSRGGGVVADMAAYALSPGRVLGGGDLITVEVSDAHLDDRGLDLGFHVTAMYESGLQVHGTFNIDGEYVNRLDVTGKGWRAVLSPAFSSKPDARLPVNVTVGDEDLGFTAPASDPFVAFLTAASTAASASPQSWTQATATSVSDTLRLAAACGLAWGDARGVD